MLAENINYQNGDLVSYEEFIAIAKNVNCKVEYIDSRIYFMAGGSPNHTLIGVNVRDILYEYFKENKCKVMQEQALWYKDEKINKLIPVYPDIMIVCDYKESIVNNKYVGVPNLVIEILSKSTRKRDATVKKELYKKLGVKEYLTIDQYSPNIRVYDYDNNFFGQYHSLDDEENYIFKSKIFDGLEIKLVDVFKDII